MSAADDDDTPLIIELAEECGFNPIDLSTEAAAEITLAAKTAKENHSETHSMRFSQSESTPS
jgi:hypothetical protein